MAMPATGPIPAEVGKCFEGKPGKYGRDLVSTGPYMIQGSDAVDISSCAKLKPTSGFDGQTSHDRSSATRTTARATDSKAAARTSRTSSCSSSTRTPTTSTTRSRPASSRTRTSSIPPQVLQKYATDPSLKSDLHQNSGDRTWYLTMNLTQPPFDDVHVRRAMNWDHGQGTRSGRRGAARPSATSRTTSSRTRCFNGQLADYDAVQDARRPRQRREGEGGDEGLEVRHEAQRHVQRQGVQERAADRRHPRESTPDASGHRGQRGEDRHHLHGAHGRRVPTRRSRRPAKNIPIAERPGWGKDYADALTFFSPLFDGRTIIPAGNTNYSLVGITPATAKKVGVKGNLKNVPSVNEDLDQLRDAHRSAAPTCYENLDKKLMTDVVPWVPYLWSSATHIAGRTSRKWDFDQFGGSPGYGHVAVK